MWSLSGNEHMWYNFAILPFFILKYFVYIIIVLTFRILVHLEANFCPIFKRMGYAPNMFGGCHVSTL